MENLLDINEKIKTLKSACDFLKQEYTKSELHKKEAHPSSTIPSSPENEEILRLLTDIPQLDLHIKKLQDAQFELFKKQAQD